MRLRNILIVVKNIEKSKKFYHDLFGLDIILDNDGNVILTEGLVLQDEKVWKDVTGKEVVPENNSCELYFEERNKIRKTVSGNQICHQADDVQLGTESDPFL